MLHDVFDLQNRLGHQACTLTSSTPARRRPLRARATVRPPSFGIVRVGSDSWNSLRPSACCSSPPSFSRGGSPGSSRAAVRGRGRGRRRCSRGARCSSTRPATCSGIVLVLGCAALAWGYGKIRFPPGQLPSLAAAGAVVGVLSLLFVFKYFNFFLEAFAFPDAVPRLDSVLPVGISFYAFSGRLLVTCTAAWPTHRSFHEIRCSWRSVRTSLQVPLPVRNIAPQCERAPRRMHLLPRSRPRRGVSRRLVVADTGPVCEPHLELGDTRWPP